MRITGGTFGGRNLKVPKSDLIRPTQDRVREALFNIIQFELPGKDFLDLFAGSGAVGIEALSRGAKSATFVEKERRHLAVLRENLSDVTSGRAVSMKPPTTATICADVYSYMRNYVGPGFDIAFADPPYALGEKRGYEGVLAALAERNVVRPGGLFIAEMTAIPTEALGDRALPPSDGRGGRPRPPAWELIRDRTYGKTRICMWRRNNEPNT